MDGNGRWATRRGLPRTAGHDAGEVAILEAIDAALAARIRWLTLFAFSTENWTRPRHEVEFLMAFNRRMISAHGETFHRRGICVRYMGRASERVPLELKREMEHIQARTSSNSTLTLTFAFDYGGRAEVVAAVRRIIEADVRPEEVTEQTISAHLWYPDMPDPDLIIRTAGEFRLSNFLLWRAAYSELVFMDEYWPDFRGGHFVAALEEYARRQRRFGSLDGDADAGMGLIGPSEVDPPNC